MERDLRITLTKAVGDVQRLLYCWPGPPDAESARATGRGTCAAKHALLRDALRSHGFVCSKLLVVGPLAPELWPDLADLAGGLLEVHECLTVESSWAGPLLVDVTWHPAAVKAGLPGTLDWNGQTDMTCAVDPLASYAVSDTDFRGQKEKLRSRLYSTDQRALRDHVLAQIAVRAESLA